MTFIIFSGVQTIFITAFSVQLIEIVKGDGEDSGNQLLFHRVILGLYVVVLVVMLVCFAYFIGVFHEAKSSSSGQLRRFTRVFFLLHVWLTLCIVLLCNKDNEFPLLLILLVNSNIHFLKTSYLYIFVSSLLFVVVYIVLQLVNTLSASEFFLAIFQPCVIGVLLTHALS